MIFLFAAAAFVQEPEIVVTGRGLDAGLGEQAYDVTQIGRDRLEHSASNRLEDVLRDVPGFQQFRRSDARSANPTSQGATLRALGGNGLEPGAADPRRRAADRPVRRLDRLARL